MTYEREQYMRRQEADHDLLRMRDPARAVRRKRHCPTCTSPSPERHPAVQHGGEVELCVDDFHLRPTNQNPPEYIAAVMAKRAALNPTTTEQEKSA